MSSAAGPGGGGVGGSSTPVGGNSSSSQGGNSNPTEFSDFPASPIISGQLPADISSLFNSGTEEPSGGPCLAEPPIDAMVPKNWTALLFEWSAPTEQNVFELRLHVDNQVNDLLLYTTQNTFTIDATMWESFTDHSAGHDIEVTLRGATVQGSQLSAGPFLGAAGSVHLAPVEAPGSVVYWASTSGTSFQGFTIGDASPVTVLTPTTAGNTSTGGQTTCVSCHASSPDGEVIIYTRDADNGTRAVDARRIDGTGPPLEEEISSAALNLLGRHKQSAPIFSAAHYSPADAVAISVFSNALTGNRDELIWTDMHATDDSGWGQLARTGDPREAASPDWRHDGTAIAYVSADTVGEGVVANGNLDIYTVPYQNKAGGNATPLIGASETAYQEFYPVYSPNDTLLAFNRSALAVSSYDQPSAELFVLPAEGGTAQRLRANDPPTCTGLSSPGLTNSWARWAPTAEASGGLNYYWLVFSSKRHILGGNTQAVLPQLYIASIVTELVDEAEVLVAEYPAIYVTSQNSDESNHTPAWDVFKVDRIPK